MINLYISKPVWIGLCYSLQENIITCSYLFHILLILHMLSLVTTLYLLFHWSQLYCRDPVGFFFPSPVSGLILSIFYPSDNRAVEPLAFRPWCFVMVCGVLVFSPHWLNPSCHIQLSCPPGAYSLVKDFCYNFCLALGQWHIPYSPPGYHRKRNHFKMK